MLQKKISMEYLTVSAKGYVKCMKYTNTTYIYVSQKNGIGCIIL